jgi:DNA end-binding protein Ku
MARPIWKGALSFGLVTIPVGLYAATERQAEIAFRQLHRKDHAPIQYKRVCSAEGVEVAWQDIEKGYEYAKDQFIVVTDEDLEKAKVVGSQMIEIREFVPAGQIDFAHFEAPYWLAPDKAGAKAYALLRDALAKSGRVGIATFVMRQREHLAALRPEGRGIMLTTMRFADELRRADDLPLPGNTEHPQKEMDLAVQLVEALADDWDPAEYRDTYRETLRAMIEQKVEGKEIAAPKLPGPPKVTDLMEALRESLARKGDLKKAPSREQVAEPAAAKRRRRPGRRRPAA